MAHGFRGMGRSVQKGQMASQGKHGQALGLAYSVLEPHVVLAAGVSRSLLSVCLCMCKSVIAKNFETPPPPP